nr:hypothetical protein [uncultured Albidiferax sp.]
MKISNAASTALAAQQAAAAAKKSTVGSFERNAKEFGPIAASAIGLASSAGQVVDEVTSEIKEAATHTVALANTVANGVGTAASAAARYASTGLSATVQAINALV